MALNAVIAVVTAIITLQRSPETLAAQRATFKSYSFEVRRGKTWSIDGHPNLRHSSSPRGLITRMYSPSTLQADTPTYDLTDAH